RLLYLPSFPTRRSSDLKSFGQVSDKISVDLADSRLPFISALVDMYCFYPFPNDLTKTVSPFPSPILHEISIDISTFNYCAPTYKDRKSTRLNSSHVSIS